MPKNEIQKLILQEVQAVKADVKEVREKDIPALNTAMAVQKQEIESQRKDLEERTSKRSTLIAAIGGAITVVISVGSAIAVMLLK